MNEYELMYIVPTSYTEEELGTVEKNVSDLLAKQSATIVRSSRLGKLKFAYPIRHERFGHYILVRFTAETKAVAAINEGLRLNQKEVLRHLIVSADEVGEGKFSLVQYQEVHVEGGDRRRRQAPKGKEEDKTKEEKEIREGVAAIEEGGSEGGLERGGIEALSAEDLQKKIDSALFSDTNASEEPAKAENA